MFGVFPFIQDLLDGFAGLDVYFGEHLEVPAHHVGHRVAIEVAFPEHRVDLLHRLLVADNSIFFKHFLEGLFLLLSALFRDLVKSDGELLLAAEVSPEKVRLDRVQADRVSVPRLDKVNAFCPGDCLEKLVCETDSLLSQVERLVVRRKAVAAILLAFAALNTVVRGRAFLERSWLWLYLLLLLELLHRGGLLLAECDVRFANCKVMLLDHRFEVWVRFTANEG